MCAQNNFSEVECPKPVEGHCFLYILQCSDGSLYIGHSANVALRIIAHSDGNGAQWTASRTPLKLVYIEDHPNQLTAFRREKQIKGWSRAKKAALVRGEADALRKLAKGKG
jgi:putative endonuclease